MSSAPQAAEKFAESLSDTKITRAVYVSRRAQATYDA